jgi:RNA polymerase sigma-70 factor (ECF subfamily)
VLGSQALDTLSEIMASVLDGRRPEASAAVTAVERLQAGDLAALGHAYDEHHAAVRAFARRLVGDAHAEDLVHDTFLSLPKALPRWNGQGALRTFILGVAVNHARHYTRSRFRLQALLERFGREPERPAVSQEELSDQKRLAALLAGALEQLSFDHRTAFVLCEIEERPSSEVARILGIPEGTVRTRLHHARQKLRARLEREAAR